MPRSPEHIASDSEFSESDEDYDENVKLLLNNRQDQSESDSEEEVLNANVQSSDDDKSNIALSDVEGQDDDNLPNIRAWGKDKRQYYSTDYVDQDYFGFEGKSAHFAELEEEEARNLQKQLALELDDNDFSLEFDNKDEKKSELKEEVIRSDISKLSQRHKLQLLKEEFPEFTGLVGDLETSLKVARDYLRPCLMKFKKGQIPNSPALEFVDTYYHLSLNYCTNIHMYLLLKSSRENVRKHPVVKKLYQYRHLLSKMHPTFEDIIKPQLELLLREGDKKTKKKLSILKKLDKKLIPEENEEKEEDTKIEVAEIEEDAAEEVSGAERRAITYQMAKNKGLTPYRKKDQRNPRVKHRNKYRKAKIRRKGAVREPRRELQRYSGEISGIKSTVKKSIKIKS